MSAVDGSRPLGPSVRAFDRGLDILACFGTAAPPLTVAEVAAAAGLDRTTARRLLATLEAHRLVETVGGRFRPTARVLELGYAGLAAQDFPTLVLPYLDAAAARIGQSCSVGVFDGEAAVFLARAAVRRVMTIALAPGTRVPAYASALGRVLLGGLDRAELDAYLDRVPLVALTARTTTDPGELRHRVADARAAGWALLDQELELGVQSVAVPVRDGDGTVRAALTVGTNVGVVDLAVLTGSILEHLREAATAIERDLTARPVPLPAIEALSTPSAFSPPLGRVRAADPAGAG